MTTPDFIALEHVRVDVRQQRIIRSDGTERMTSREIQLLSYLFANAGRTIPREELLVEVWNYSPTSMTRAVDMLGSAMGFESAILISTVRHEMKRTLVQS